MVERLERKKLDSASLRALFVEREEIMEYDVENMIWTEPT